MKDFIEDMLLPLCGVIVIIALFLLIVCLPVAWFDGHAKAAYLKQTQGIDLPWHQATFLQVTINSVDANVRSEE